MTDIYVFNQDLEQIGVIDYYTSFIWAKRYDEVGDCEVYVQATGHAIGLLQRGCFLTRLDDEMVCRIEKIEIDTDVENGNYLIVTGKDVKNILNQRIIWAQTNIDGTAESYLRRLVQENIVNPDLSVRKIPGFGLLEEKGFRETMNEQVTYDQVGAKVQEVCKTFGYGWRVVLQDDPDTQELKFFFDLYRGADRSYDQETNQPVIFSPQYENLSTSKYVEDLTKCGNVALVAGEGEGSERKRNVFGTAEGFSRHEIYVDAKDISSAVDYKDLILSYPDGSILTDENTVYWFMDSIDILIVTDGQLEELKKQYPAGQVITKAGIRYYRAQNVKVATLDTQNNPTKASLTAVVYTPMLLSRGQEKTAEYGAVVSFEGGVEPSTTFVYEEDYFLGDIVTVENEYGIRANARIVEVVETFDENGHHVEPKFEFSEVV